MSAWVKVGMVGLMMLGLAVGLSGCCCVGSIPGLSGVPGLGGITGGEPGGIVKPPEVGTPETGSGGEKPSVLTKGLSDIPVYPGASQQEGGELPFLFKAMTSQYSSFEWRMYTTGDDTGKAAKWYQDEMPKNGWEGTVLMAGEGETGSEGAMLTYGKNMNESGEPQIIAFIMIGKDNEKTSIIIVRAETKKE